MVVHMVAELRFEFRDLRFQPDLGLKAGVGLQLAQAGGDVGLGDLLQFVGAEGFAGEAGGDAAVDDGLTQVGKGGFGFAIGEEPAGHSAEEGVTGAGRIKDGIERVS